MKYRYSPARLPLLALVVTLSGAGLAGCGGGAADTQPAVGCSLQGTAGCGGTLPDPIKPTTPPTTPTTPPVTPPVTPPDPASLAGAVQLVFSGTELPSAGLPGSEVAVTALVKDGANLALPGAKIAFSADSGILSGVEAVTDKNGMARALLGTGGVNSNRSIKVTATAGAQSGSGTVAVTGSSLDITGPSTLLLGQNADLILSLRDSARKPVAGAAISYSTGSGNSVRVRDGGAAVSNAQGQLVLRLTAGALGRDAVSASALGASISQAYAVAGSDLQLTPAVGQDASGADVLQEVPTLACQAIDVRYARADTGVPQSGSASLYTSRGVLFGDSACTAAVASSLVFSNGNLPRSYLQSANAGLATITAAVAGGPTAQTRLEFVALPGPASKLGVQAEPAVLGSNNGADTAQASTISAVVRDGPANNLVKHAPVVFSILSDPSGGYLRQTGRVLTGSDGMAQAVYVAGPADSGRDGVLIQARIEGATQAAASAQVRLTVARKALSIKVGTGNGVREYSTSLLQKEFAVLVSDSAGNAVPGVTITAAAWPVRYGKGYYVWEADKADFPDTGVWRLTLPRYSCANEDVLRNGIYDAAYDLNGNGVLDPGIPVAVTAGGVSDALGLSSITVSYPRNYGSWVQLALTVRGTVAGTESSTTMELPLPTLAKDFSERRTPPPGQTSPYGTGPCNTPN